MICKRSWFHESLFISKIQILAAKGEINELVFGATFNSDSRDVNEEKEEDVLWWCDAIDVWMEAPSFCLSSLSSLWAATCTLLPTANMPFMNILSAAPAAFGLN